MPHQSPFIDVQNISYEYPNLRALDDVSFQIEPQTITALVGHNGAGKSTLLRCIATLDTPFSGEIFVDGINTQNSPRQLHKKLGYLSDFFGLYDNLTVEQCLTYMAWSRGIYEGLEERIATLAEQLDLTKLLQRRSQDLSRGQRQRLAIGQATIHSPQILLLDEPASGLDPEARHQLSTLLKNLQSQGMTIIVSSHILTELEDYCSQMLILHGGKIKEHIALADINKSQDLSTITIEMMQYDEKYSEIFAGINNVKNFNHENNTITVEFEGNDEKKAKFLHYLILQELPILSFTSNKKSFENIYIEAINHDK